MMLGAGMRDLVSHLFSRGAGNPRGTTRPVTRLTTIPGSVHVMATVVCAVAMLADLGCGVPGFGERKAGSRP
jgi:hypothetical protein